MAACFSTPPRLLIVSGLQREAAIFAGTDAISICGDASTLRARLAKFNDFPLRLVISFGVCAGLDPALRRGDVILGTEVVWGGESIGADPTAANELTRRVADLGGRLLQGRIAATEAPVLTPEAKSQLRAATGAVAVDMESLVAGRFAKARGAPFAILRAVSDSAHRTLPPLVLNALDSDGGVNVRAVIGELIRSPSQLPGLVAAAVDSSAAFRVLGRCRSLARLRLDVGLPQL